MKKKIVLLYSIPLVLIVFGGYILLWQPSIISSDFNSQSVETLNNPYKNSLKDVLILFSSLNNIRDEICKYIKLEKKQISMASFRFTDKVIYEALKEAYLRGIKIEIVADRGCLGSVYSKVLNMHNLGAPIYIYPPLEKKNNLINIMKNEDDYKITTGLMHNKFLIFHSQKTVITGSYNFTKSAQDINEENSIIMPNNTTILQHYLTYFEYLKKKSSVLKNGSKKKSLLHKKI